jgi:hypothetical protein
MNATYAIYLVRRGVERRREGKRNKIKQNMKRNVQGAIKLKGQDKGKEKRESYVKGNKKSKGQECSKEDEKTARPKKR